MGEWGVGSKAQDSKGTSRGSVSESLRMASK